MLSDEITYYVITLKQKLSSFASGLCLKSKYGEEECSECWDEAILSGRLIEILQCYDTTDGALNCLCEKEVRQIFQTASKLVNKKGCGC